MRKMPFETTEIRIIFAYSSVCVVCYIEYYSTHIFHVENIKSCWQQSVCAVNTTEQAHMWFYIPVLDGVLYKHNMLKRYTTFIPEHFQGIILLRF